MSDVQRAEEKSVDRAAPHDSFAPLRVPGFRWFVVSVLTMAMGAQIQGVVVAWQSLPVDVAAAKARGRERNLYQLEARTTGFQAVTIWLREVTVARGETVSVELTDRNEWFRGVIEEKTLDAGH